jgi:hypothetical protein
MARGSEKKPFALGRPMRTYETELARQPDWAMREGSMHFDEKSAVHDTLRQMVARLKELNVPFAVVGGMALFLHGFRRFTEDVDVLVTAEGMRQVHQALDGLGYVPPFGGSKQLRDTSSGVRIEFLVSGAYPGDGKPKAVAFPDPRGRTVEINGIPTLRLSDLIELKLASGMTNPGRLKDLADVQELIRLLRLPRSFAETINPYVGPKFLELWQGVQEAPSNSEE